jgi:hypothetical protein
MSKTLIAYALGLIVISASALDWDWFSNERLSEVWD